MLEIQTVDHIGIRISDKTLSVPFYELPGFKFDGDAGFEQGHPIIMEHPSGVVLNLLGPANKDVGTNILMDVDERYTGITHVALRIKSLESTKDFLAENGIETTGSLRFGNLAAVFIRDPDRNVIELDERSGPATSEQGNYDDHP